MATFDKHCKRFPIPPFQAAPRPRHGLRGARREAGPEARRWTAGPVRMIPPTESKRELVTPLMKDSHLTSDHCSCGTPLPIFVFQIMIVEVIPARSDQVLANSLNMTVHNHQNITEHFRITLNNFWKSLQICATTHVVPRTHFRQLSEISCNSATFPEKFSKFEAENQWNILIICQTQIDRQISSIWMRLESWRLADSTWSMFHWAWHFRVPKSHLFIAK